MDQTSLNFAAGMPESSTLSSLSSSSSSSSFITTTTPSSSSSSDLSSSSPFLLLLLPRILQSDPNPGPPDNYGDAVPWYIGISLISVLATSLVTLVSRSSSRVRNDHYSVMVQTITACDLLYTLKFFVSAVAWSAGKTDPRASFHLFRDNCMTAAAYGVFTGLACIAWNAAWIFDFLCVLINPLRNTASQRRWYHVGVWGLCLFATVWTLATSGQESADNHTCLIRGTDASSLVFEIPLVSSLILAVGSLIFAAFRLSRGTHTTASLRRKLLVRHAAYVLAFVVLWVWPLFHEFINIQGLNNDGNDGWLAIMDALSVSGQAAVMAGIRLSEPGAYSILQRLLRGYSREISRNYRSLLRKFCCKACLGHHNHRALVQQKDTGSAFNNNNTNNAVMQAVGNGRGGDGALQQANNRSSMVGGGAQRENNNNNNNNNEDNHAMKVDEDRLLGHPNHTMSARDIQASVDRVEDQNARASLFSGLGRLRKILLATPEHKKGGATGGGGGGNGSDNSSGDSGDMNGMNGSRDVRASSAAALLGTGDAGARSHNSHANSGNAFRNTEEFSSLASSSSSSNSGTNISSLMYQLKNAMSSAVGFGQDTTDGRITVSVDDVNSREDSSSSSSSTTNIMSSKRTNVKNSKTGLKQPLLGDDEAEAEFQARKLHTATVTGNDRRNEDPSNVSNNNKRNTPKSPKQVDSFADEKSDEESEEDEEEEDEEEKEDDGFDLAAGLRQEMGNAMLSALCQAVAAADGIVKPQHHPHHHHHQQQQQQHTQSGGVHTSSSQASGFASTAGSISMQSFQASETESTISSSSSTVSASTDTSAYVSASPTAPGDFRSISSWLRDPTTQTRKVPIVPPPHLKPISVKEQEEEQNQRQLSPQDPPPLPPRRRLAQGDAVEVVSFAEAEFRAVRRAAGLLPEEVVSCFHPDHLASGKLNAHFSEGASSAFFCRSEDGSLIVKTISASEAEVLLRLLPSYTRHLSSNPDSLLARVYGCFGVQLQDVTTKSTLSNNSTSSGTSSIYFILMGNVFPISDPGPSALIFDLKGSTVNRRARVTKSVKQPPVNHHHNNSSNNNHAGTNAGGNSNGPNSDINTNEAPPPPKAPTMLYQDIEFREAIPYGLPVADVHTMIEAHTSRTDGFTPSPTAAPIHTSTSATAAAAAAAHAAFGNGNRMIMAMGGGHGGGQAGGASSSGSSHSNSESSSSYLSTLPAPLPASTMAAYPDLRMGITRARALVDQLQRDVTLLVSQGLMDYSLLLQMVPVSEEAELEYYFDGDEEGAEDEEEKGAHDVEGREESMQAEHERLHTSKPHPTISVFENTHDLDHVNNPSGDDQHEHMIEREEEEQRDEDEDDEDEDNDIKLSFQQARAIGPRYAEHLMRVLTNRASAAPLAMVAPADGSGGGSSGNGDVGLSPTLKAPHGSWANLSRVSSTGSAAAPTATTQTAPTLNRISKFSALSVHVCALGTPQLAGTAATTTTTTAATAATAPPPPYARRVIVQLGMVDLFQFFGAGKRVEAAFKALRHGTLEPDVSAVDPHRYAVRFMAFTSSVFTPVG